MIRKFRKDNRGSTVIEYALIAALVAVAIIGSLTTVGNSSTVQLQNVADKM